jgi:eukaryotic-like serine/threonine-protein kinase
MTADSKRFQPLGPLLSGAGSRAFLGIERRAEGPRAVVLVWVPDDVVQDAKRLARLRRETEQAARLDHPNIIHVYGFEDLDEGPARVVEFADGESLRRILDTARSAGRPLPPWIAAGIVADACFGVHYAHKLGEADASRPIVHGNLCPETLFVSFHGITKVSGYGAIEVAPKPEAGSPANKRVYLAPEQVVGGSGVLSPSTDLYALGAVLYETIAGKPPFLDESDLDLAILTKPPPPLSVAGVPDALGQVVLKAMAKRSVDRFPTALAMREAIQAAYTLSTPSPADVAALLDQLFPANGGEREARRQLLASALSPSGLHVIPDSEFELIPPPAEAENVAALPTSPAASGPVAAAATTRPAAPPRGIEADTHTRAGDAPRRHPRLLAVVVLIGVLAALGLGVLLGRNLGSKAREEGSGSQPPASPAVESTSAAPGVSTTTPPSRDFDSTLDEIASRPLAPRAERRKVTLSVESEPPTEIFVDGKKAGRTPVEILVEPGRHRLRAIDKVNGIDEEKPVDVEASERAEEKFIFGVATLIITAPEGAEIVIDGRKIGTAPLQQPITVYEGTHSIRATLGDREPLDEKLTVHAGERLTFDIQPTE